MSRSIAVLGPQQPIETAGAVMRQLVPSGTIVTINAGWQDRESVDQDLHAAFDARTVNLGLFQRAERVWVADPALRQAHQQMQSDMRVLRAAYVDQLHYRMDAWRSLEQMSGPDDLLDPEREAALAAVRALDDRYLDRIEELMRSYFDAVGSGDHPTVDQERVEVEKVLGEASGVAIAGGHVAVLLNRLRLFGVDKMFPDVPVVAWSGGGMVLSDRVVAFHDDPPQGGSSAEMLLRGLGLVPDTVFLPHAASRLTLDDPARVRRLTRRFAPAACIPLDGGEGVLFDDDGCSALVGSGVQGARLLKQDGSMEALAA